MTHVHYGTEDKRPAAEQTLAALGFDWSQAAAIGDDWPDLPVLRRCAFAAAPANAHVEVRSAAPLRHAGARGGHGAAREFCDLLLVASGRYAQLLEAYAVTPRDARPGRLRAPGTALTHLPARHPDGPAGAGHLLAGAQHADASRPAGRERGADARARLLHARLLGEDLRRRRAA